MVRVVSSGGKNETSKKLTGLWKITLRPDCRVKGTDFFMVPSIDLQDESQHTDEIPFEFTEDMEGVLDWGEKRGLLAGNPDSIKLSIGDVAREWNTTILQEHSVTNFGIVVRAVFGLLFLYCCARECWGLYKRRQLASNIASAIDARFSRRDEEEQVEMTLMQPSAPAPAASATPMLETSYIAGYAPPTMPAMKR